MKSLEIHVKGEPKGQPRPRAVRRGFRAGVYDPGTANNWKALVREAAKDKLQRYPGLLVTPIFRGPVRVEITLWFPRPKSHFLKSGIRETAPTYHTGKPDRDNCDKAILDALGAEELQIWRDDAQVCAGGTTKLYAAEGQAAGARIHILSLD